jgi:hypothetical protein
MISRRRRDNDALGVRNATVDGTDAIGKENKRRSRRYIWARLLNVWSGSARLLIPVSFGIILTFTVVISSSLSILQREASAPQGSYDKFSRQAALRKELIKMPPLNDKVTKPPAGTQPKQVQSESSEIIDETRTNSIVFPWRAKIAGLKVPIFEPDYGNIKFHSIKNKDPFSRHISSRDTQHYEEYRGELLHYDHERPPVDAQYDHLDDDEPRECRRNSWRMEHYPTCNNVHELTLDRIRSSRNEQDYNVKYLAEGSFRLTFKFDRPG